MGAKVQAGGILRKSRDLSWQTPEFVLERARACFGGPIPFDPATAPNNPTKAERFCAGPSGTLFAKDTLESKNGLEVSWDWPFWVNPPFNKPWITKIGDEAARGAPGLALLPCNRFEEPYLRRVLVLSDVVCFVDAKPFQSDLKRAGRRIAFISSIDGKAVEANPFASMILGFNLKKLTGRVGFVTAFGPLGTCFVLASLSAPAPAGASS